MPMPPGPSPAGGPSRATTRPLPSAVGTVSWRSDGGTSTPDSSRCLSTHTGMLYVAFSRWGTKDEQRGCVPEYSVGRISMEVTQVALVKLPGVNTFTHSMTFLAGAAGTGYGMPLMTM